VALVVRQDQPLEMVLMVMQVVPHRLELIYILMAEAKVEEDFPLAAFMAVVVAVLAVLEAVLLLAVTHKPIILVMPELMELIT
jgi:hypothetical protein